MENKDFQYMKPEDINFESTEDIEFAIIHPGTIDEFDYNDPGYLTGIIKKLTIDTVKCKSSDFIVKVNEYLKNDSLAGDNTQVTKISIHDEPNYLYELLYLDIHSTNGSILTPELYNGLATLMNIEKNHIFGNVIVLKTYLPIDNINSMKLIAADKKDIFNILDARVKIKVVIYEDGEFREDISHKDIEKYSKKIFSDNYFQSKELSFLLHNININYTLDEYGEEFMPNLVKGKIDLAIFYTMNTDELLGHITLDEIKKIIHLSNKLDDFSSNDDLTCEERDKLDRPMVKNKYRILEKMYNLNK
jgi:hypothetical protein